MAIASPGRNSSDAMQRCLSARKLNWLKDFVYMASPLRFKSHAKPHATPELVAEIAASIAAYDLHDKKRAYRRNGIREYIVWQMFENKLDCFSLREGEYVPLAPAEKELLEILEIARIAEQKIPDFSQVSRL